MKKLFSLVLALVMMLALAVNASAATGSKITVDGTKPGETYEVYKIFDAVEDATHTNFNYTISVDSDWYDLIDAYEFDYGEGKEDVFSFQAIAGDSANKTVIYASKFASTDGAGADFAAYLKSNLGAIGATPVASKTAASTGAVEFDGLGLGYYFVTTTTGSLCAIDTNNVNVAIKEKNAYPTIDKKISATAGNYGDEAITAYIGDTVYYQLTMPVPATVEVNNVVVHDEFEVGLTLNENSFAAVDANGQAIEFTKNVAEGSFTLTFAPTAVAGKTVTITYNAELDKDAEIATATNDNTAWLTYSAYTSAKDTVSVLTYETSIIKVKGDTQDPLAGVEFELYDGATKLSVVTTAVDGVYRIADSTQSNDAITTLTTPASGVIEVEGLEGGKTYTLKETKTVDGYNLLAEDASIVIGSSNNMYAFGATKNADNNVIRNYTGLELPSTGGVGTTIFYTVGGVMMAAAFVLFITKKKMANEQ